MKNGAEGESRTRTTVGHYPLKIACLPIPPLRHYFDAIYTLTGIKKQELCLHLGNDDGGRIGKGSGEKCDSVETKLPAHGYNDCSILNVGATPFSKGCFSFYL